MSWGGPAAGGGRDGGFGDRLPVGSVGKAILVLIVLLGVAIVYLLVTGQPLQ